MIENKKRLNKEQQEAVEFGSGSLLIVAGAGTGKTTVITERIKWLIAHGLAKPEEILALTFTEKAAVEMENRVDQALPYGTFGMWISTFHSFCDQILRSEALALGLSPHYKLMTEAESWLFVKKNFWKFNLTVFRPTGNPYKFIEGMLAHFSRLKDEDISPEDYKNEEYPELVEAYKTYEKLKADEGVMDFSDLIFYCLKLFRTRKNIRQRYQKLFKYILVDEFQDTNFAQNELVKLLANDDFNINVVADDDQSIYRFRGAAVSNVLQFKKDFPKTKIVVLSKNYRSTQEILDRSYELIQHNNPDRLEVAAKIDKKLIAVSNKTNLDVELVFADRVENEAEQVVKAIKSLESKYEWKDFSILVRANNHADPFVNALERSRVPFQFLGPGMLFKQPEIKDLIAYLKVLYDFTDSVSLYRVMSMPIFKFTQRDLIEVLNKAKKVNLSLFEQLEKEDSFSDFVKMVHRHQELVAKETAGQILYFFLEDSGLLKNIVEYKTAVEEKRALNITKFFDKLKSFEGANADANVFAVVDYLDLAMDMGESPLAATVDWSENNAVNILTVHSSKGLEFPVVILANLVEGRFPSRERKDQIPVPEELIKEVLPTGDFHLEEERRLFYVGMTRAKERLIFSAAKFYGEGKRERKLSPFVTEAIGKQEYKTETSEQIPLLNWQKIEPETEEKPQIKIESLSYSAIEAFHTCPLHYKLRYILKIPTPLRAALSMGNSIHLVLKDFYNLVKDDQTKEELLELLAKVWLAEGYGDKKHEQEALVKSQKFLADYLKTDLHKNANPIYLEQLFNFKVKDLRISGKMDRIDDLGNGEIEIIDYKTGANVPTQKEIDGDLQMTIYAIAASETLQKPIEKIKLSFFYFDNQSKVTTTRKKEQLDEAKKELLLIRDEIEKSDFACSGGRLCENCEYKMLCG